MSGVANGERLTLGLICPPRPDDGVPGYDVPVGRVAETAQLWQARLATPHSLFDITVLPVGDDDLPIADGPLQRNPVADRFAKEVGELGGLLVATMLGNFPVPMSRTALTRVEVADKLGKPVFLQQPPSFIQAPRLSALGSPAGTILRSPGVRVLSSGWTPREILDAMEGHARTAQQSSGHKGGS